MICRTGFYLDFSATLNIQPLRSGPLVQSKLNVPGTALDREEFAGLGFREVLTQPGNGKPGNADDEFEPEVLPAEICDDVPELVDAQHAAHKLIALWTRPR